MPTVYYNRQRIGATYKLRASYAIGTTFQLEWGSIITNTFAHPTFAISATDQSGNYPAAGANPSTKIAWDWENSWSAVLDRGFIGGTSLVRIPIPYATLSPFFGLNVSIIVVEYNEIAGSVTSPPYYWFRGDHGFLPNANENNYFLTLPRILVTPP